MGGFDGQSFSICLLYVTALWGGSTIPQPNLALGDATDEEVLTRQRQLATAFRRSACVGVSGTFGSPYSNVVNTGIGNLLWTAGGKRRGR